MRALSATEAISPAWDHSRRLLVAPRSWKIWLKVGLLAIFSQMSSCHGSFNSGHNSQMPGLNPGVMAGMVALAIMFGIIGFIFTALFFYLSSRLQFVFFDVVLRRDTIIGPIWTRYGRATWYWIGLKLLFIVIALLCLSPLLIPAMLQIIHTFPALVAGKTPHFGDIFKLIVSLAVPIFAAVLVFGTGFRLLYDFGLPSMALEGTPLGETVKRIFRLFRADPLQMLLYLLLHFVLSLGLGLANLILFCFTILIALIPLGGAGAGLWFSLRHAGVGGYVVIGLGVVILCLILLVIIFAICLVLTAWVRTFLQAYALYFLGGRYPLLGAYLQPPPPPPPPPVVTTPWPPDVLPPAPPLPIEGEP